ncbi:taurine catabolism dioxygenase [Violaceomyces palustris]|uniref:Taurine catabolism dioxygenase n=1 Tax=Violaceomyces palustris TaxID=1673888 RepID=A0ACD0NTJ0_9BASI|nr:taurine catabolism dioxygenase [Violaceomyces palustris]
MAPTAEVQSRTNVEATTVAPGKLASLKGDSKLIREPLRLTGILDKYENFDVTPVIGREYPTIQIRDLLKDEKSDELLRELATIISRRGVVFFRNQDLTPEEQKTFTDAIGRAAGKPKDSGLHIHPIVNAERDGEFTAVDDKGTANTDNEISVISSKLRKAFEYRRRKGGDSEWHSDITFEPVPSDYTSLKVHTLPPTGGDTLWSSGYEIYDLLSPSFRSYLETLTGHFAQPEFNRAAERGGFKVHPGPRGSDLNVGETLEAEHPFIRTNPVTGWKSVFGLGSHFDSLKDLDPAESQIIKDYILKLVTTSHGAQVRFKWSKNDLAIWDNRSVYHAANPDYIGLGERAGVRAVSIGEKPYFDSASRSRREELGDSRII